MLTFDPSTQGVKAVDLSEFKNNLVYTVSSRTSKATKKDPVPKTKSDKDNDNRKHGAVNTLKHTCKTQNPKDTVYV